MCSYFIKLHISKGADVRSTTKVGILILSIIFRASLCNINDKSQ
jgi:hypothetical protein